MNYWNQQQAPAQAQAQWAPPQQQNQGWGQQQNQGWGQQQQQQAPAANNKDVTLVVTGCNHATVGGIVRGTFQLHGENHGKPTYKKDGQVNGLDVMSYYWDERDGPGFCGWWFGPKVGGDQVWAYHTDKAASMPPQGGWKVPYDGPVDPSLNIAYKPKGGAAPQQQQQQPAWGQHQQQQQQQPQQQGGWGQQNQGGWGQQNQQKSAEQQRFDQQRQQLEDIKKRQATENQQRAEQMRQQQMQEQQRKIEQNKLQAQQANEARIAEQKRKMEEMKRQQAELMKKRADEQKRKEDEMAAKRAEHSSGLAIKKALQVYRTTNVNNFEDAKKKLDEVLAEHTPKLGSQTEPIMKEIETTRKQVETRVNQVLEAKRKDEEKKEAENKRRKDLREKAVALVEELEQMIAKGEAKAKTVVAKAETMTGDKELKMTEIETCASAVEKATDEIAEQMKVCGDFVLKESVNIKNVPAIPGEPMATCAQDLGKLVLRMNECKKTNQATLTKVGAAKIVRVKKAKAKEKFETSFSIIKKYDTDKDGKLSRREVRAWAKGEFGFEVPAETLDSICERLIADNSKGVDRGDFHKMRAMVGVAREAAMDAKRKASREAREKTIEQLKEKLSKTAEGIAEALKETGEAVTKAEKSATALLGNKAVMTAAELLAQVKAADEELQAAQASFDTAKKTINDLAGETEPELKSWLAGEVKKLNATANPYEQRLTKSTGIVTKTRTEAEKKNNEELEKLRADGLAMMYHHQGAKKLLSLGLYEHFDKRKKGKIDESAFVRFFSICELKDEDDARMSDEDAARLFAHLDSDDAGFITKDQFMNLTRRFMKVIKASVMTTDQSLKSKPLRRLEEGEVLECLTGPTPVEGEDVTRIKVKAMEDDAEGWVTPVGNRGTTFIEDGGNIFKVVKDTILTGAFTIGGGSAAKDRKLKVGELLEVREWERKEEVSGLLRMKVRVKSDGQVGYVTTVGNTGIKFVEVHA